VKTSPDAAFHVMQVKAQKNFSIGSILIIARTAESIKKTVAEVVRKALGI
jgi:tRNA splicing endonuclease